MEEIAFANVSADGTITIDDKMNRGGTLCAFFGPRDQVKETVEVTARHGYNSADGKSRDPERPPLFICSGVRDAVLEAPHVAEPDPRRALTLYAAWACKRSEALVQAAR